jgi:hypothetical protein
MVAEAEAVAKAEGSIWTTGNARSLGAAGVASPGHAVTRNLQELGKTSQSPPAQDGCGSPDNKGPGLCRYGCIGKGANKHLVEEVAGGRGQPETIGEGLAGVV